MEFDGVKVTFETKLKIVGVIYDNKLNWRQMASEMASKGRQALGFLKRLVGSLISTKDLCAIYEYFARSKMEYGCTLYIGATPSHLEKIDKLQRRAKKMTGLISSLNLYQLGEKQRVSASYHDMQESEW